ncbi:hypothetical protein F943_01992 [Acinetobacter ursingii NIPH 706]|nr:hypothetical protein F943_01992 [Acinetobacter ursingii NIPH 706]VTX73527.1 Uncharacterised protein [Acinetobacter ursingii]
MNRVKCLISHLMSVNFFALATTLTYYPYTCYPFLRHNHQLATAPQILYHTAFKSGCFL